MSEEITCGERFIRCLTGEPVDRIPFGVGIGYYPWSATLDRWREETGKPKLWLPDELGYDGSSTIPSAISGIYPDFEVRILDEDDEMMTWRDARGVTQRGRKDGCSMPEFLEYPVKTPEDWQKLKEERLRIDEPARMTENWDKFRAKIEKTGEAVQVGDFPWGVFGSPRDLMGAEELLIAFYTEPEMVKDMMEHLTSLWISLWEKVSAEVQIDYIHIWEDMSGRQGSLISPKMTEEFMMPCYDRIAEFARTHGVRMISVDSDGDCHELIEIMTRHGVNMFLPFEVQAGNDILEYRMLYPELGIEGGLDKRALAQGRDAIDKELRKAEEMVKMGRYIPSYDHLIPPDVSWDDFVYSCERLKEICYSNRQGG